ncbi:membrane-bound lytic murein transglycosylase D [Variovorax paradoxus]|uniref:Membrane-bound lytic murein transglycosylase D n=1 Tax=Variovorax paradoxus TaxID=34073 RepID=A0AAE3Y3Z9_VARPD|nr:MULTISPECIES: transglycosylase SLT domain-containing protein [Variovorax]MBD9665720.1 transglycosylase SLT domain-containing protein [Variovorax sp. VRV01]MDP9967745.1 membrane-bound lytic murein transglycosylase D [Variovorax paradoxus]MDR6429120.1 membrane-bound lytic murein transglycosylase D [Variovorax paradoxus]MDR6453826.1 membrane-bound lytic murein transglycosylase D [Variovorax paradoxus]
MKLIAAVCLAGSLLLAGCAGTTSSSSSTAASAPSSAGGTGAKASGSAAPVYPGGPLTPITNSEAHSQSVVTLAPPADMWDRIRRGFKMPNLESDLVRDREQWYASRPDYIQRMTERSNKYIFHIVEELERRNMPTELALLPYIESAFNPQAISSARAAGMWQFMPATGTDFDLKQNIFRDDRRDVVASTRAALDYLQKLYGMFGDWQLALAAYNWGEGSVSRAIAKNQRLGLPTTYSDLSMPAETRLYVPKLQAVKNIVANPQAFNTELPLIANHPYFQTVTLTRDLDVELAAKLADIRLEDFRALNPAAHKPVLLAAGTPQILLPWDNAAVFQRNFDAYSQGQYASWTAWVVPNTMTVADAAQRSGMSEADLRALNSIPPRMLIKAGSTLIVPRSARVKEDVTALVADSGHLSFQPEIVNRRTTVKAGRNDSVASIARRYKLKPDSVAEWNDVKLNHAFKRGYSVVVYLPVRAAPEARVGSGAARAHGRAAVADKRGGSQVKAVAARGRNVVVKTPASKQVVREKRGGTPSKKKR